MVQCYPQCEYRVGMPLDIASVGRRMLTRLGRWYPNQSVLHILYAVRFTSSKDRARWESQFSSCPPAWRPLTQVDRRSDSCRLCGVCVLQSISRNCKRRFLMCSEAKIGTGKSNLLLTNVCGTFHVAKPLHGALTRVKCRDITSQLMPSAFRANNFSERQPRPIYLSRCGSCLEIHFLHADRCSGEVNQSSKTSTAITAFENARPLRGIMGPSNSLKSVHAA
jgi:hypothetical protein